MINAAKRLALIVGVTLLISGCGGGGGVRSQPSPAMPEPPPVAPEPIASESELRQEYAVHPEFLKQPALHEVNAHYAYARGATGEGIAIGIIDDGIDTSHPKLDSKVLPESYNVTGYNPDYGFCSTRDPDGYCSVVAGPPAHGTMVGGVIAANRDAMAVDGDINDIGIHGIAFDAKLISVGIPLGDAPEFYEPIDLGSPGSFEAVDQEFAGVTKRLNPDVTVINLSFGYPGNIDGYNEAALRGAFPDTIQAIAQTATPAGERAIYVWAAGNANGAIRMDGSMETADSVEIMAGLPVHIPELRGHYLAVIATDWNGEIASFSNRCGHCPGILPGCTGRGIDRPPAEHLLSNRFR